MEHLKNQQDQRVRSMLGYVFSRLPLMAIATWEVLPTPAMESELRVINRLVDHADEDLLLRARIRAQFIACGIDRILKKMKELQDDRVDYQAERFKTTKEADICHCPRCGQINNDE
jgi:hypothetical protein